MTALNWRHRGACRGADPGLFFGPDGESGPERQVREAKAKAICRHCPVTWQCASYAVRQPEKWGVWDAAGEAERATMRRNYLRHLKGYAA